MHFKPSYFVKFYLTYTMCKPDNLQILSVKEGKHSDSRRGRGQNKRKDKQALNKQKMETDGRRKRDSGLQEEVCRRGNIEQHLH